MTPTPAPRDDDHRPQVVELPPWRPTSAHVRAVAVGAFGLLVAVVTRRPDVLVLVTPSIVVATWSVLRRPQGRPVLTTRLGRRSVRESDAIAWTASVTLPRGAEDVLLGLDPGLFLEQDPPYGVVAAGREDADRPSGADGDPGDPDGLRLTARFGVRLTRWGRRPVGPGHALVGSAWAAYRSGPVSVPAQVVTVLPVSATFDPAAPLPHPRGLVGVHRAGRSGGGAEFNTLRPFQPGDRLRRIRWPVSLRTGTLHVSSTWADEDTAVVLVVDAFSDLGPRLGVDGRATSLDLTVRAAGAVAEHHLAAGDRVALRVIGSEAVRRLPGATGRHHLRRVLDTLALIEPATQRQDDGEWSTAGIPSGALVVVFSPLIEPSSVAVVARLGARGLTTVVVDTMPEHLWASGGADGPAVWTTLAWRLRQVTRQAEIQRLGDLGVPVVPWRGPASLDPVLRDITRRVRAPRLVRR